MTALHSARRPHRAGRSTRGSRRSGRGRLRRPPATIARPTATQPCAPPLPHRRRTRRVDRQSPQLCDRSARPRDACRASAARRRPSRPARAHATGVRVAIHRLPAQRLRSATRTCCHVGDAARSCSTRLPGRRQQAGAVLRAIQHVRQRRAAMREQRQLGHVPRRFGQQPAPQLVERRQRRARRVVANEQRAIAMSETVLDQHVGKTCSQCSRPAAGCHVPANAPSASNARSA